jgi:hypothetical protein
MTAGREPRKSTQTYLQFSVEVWITESEKEHSRKACPEPSRRDAQHSKSGEIKNIFLCMLGVLARYIVAKSSVQDLNRKKPIGR